MNTILNQAIAWLKDQGDASYLSDRTEGLTKEHTTAESESPGVNEIIRWCTRLLTASRNLSSSPPGTDHLRQIRGNQLRHRIISFSVKVALSCTKTAENRFSRTRLPEFIALGRDIWRSGWVTRQSTLSLTYEGTEEKRLMPFYINVIGKVVMMC